MAKWRKTLIVGAVLLATHAASAAYYAHRYASGGIRTPSRAMTLDLTPDEWAQAAVGADSTAYLQVAQNVAAGKGVTWQEPQSNPPRDVPFIFWGPGTPVVLGGWLKLVGGHTMFTFFMFAVAAQLVAGVFALATAAQWTRGTLALSLVAFGSGFCPPLQDWFYGVHLTSSEIVAVPLLALLFFVLSKAFLAWANSRAGYQLVASGESPAVQQAINGSQSPASGVAASSAAFWRWILPRGLSRWALLWFGLAGLLIGCTSLVRDCDRVFAWFLAALVIARAAAMDRRRIQAAIAVGILLVAGGYAVRYPVQLWNKHRSGRSTICTSSEGCIWRYGLWFKHDENSWYESAGLGFGEYLDPDAAPRVAAYYQSGKAGADFYSMGQLAQAIWHRPIDALAFKAARLPVLWLATDKWPQAKAYLQSVWCAAMYGLLAVFVVVQIFRRRTIPPVLYLYLLLLVCASPVMHFEFRYTFPVWSTLVLVPGLLVATLSRNGWRTSRREQRPAEAIAAALVGPSDKPLAA